MTIMLCYTKFADIVAGWSVPPIIGSTDESQESPLSHDQDTIHAEKGRAEMCDFCISALMFLTGHGIRARTHAHAKITLFPTQYIIRTWKVLGLWPHASQSLMMHLDGKCAISAWAWVLAITCMSPYGDLLTKTAAHNSNLVLKHVELHEGNFDLLHATGDVSPQMYKTTFFKLGLFWCYRSIH